MVHYAIKPALVIVGNQGLRGKAAREKVQRGKALNVLNNSIGFYQSLLLLFMTYSCLFNMLS